MTLSSPAWTVVTPSGYEWERDALDFIREALPDHEPYRAWTNFEFLTSDGAIYEVDLLVITKAGVFLVEIKSSPGRVGGDAHTWRWTAPDGSVRAIDSPLLLANRKARALGTLIARQSKHFSKIRPPRVEALVFLSHRDVELELQGHARQRILLRDRPAEPGRPERRGIRRALIEGDAPGLRQVGRAGDAEGWRPEGRFGAAPFAIDRPAAKAVARALEDLGVRPSQRARRIGDYVLEEMLDEGPGFQDHLARHASLQGEFARVRRYLVAEASSEHERARLRRAAEREFRHLRSLDHPGILTVTDFRDHEFGPALLFRHVEGAVNLDHFLTGAGSRSTFDARLDLLRDIADAVACAHRKRFVHRALGPRSVLVVPPSPGAAGSDSNQTRVRIIGWQSSLLEGTSAGYYGTTHVEPLIDPPDLVYVAPEVRRDPRNVTSAADVFSLGALAFRLFAGEAPAADVTALDRLLREQGELSLARLVDGAPASLADLVARSTKADVADRISTVADFLAGLDAILEELTAPDQPVDEVIDPLTARKGDVLEHGWRVEADLGRGSTARALLVVKVASSPSGVSYLAAQSATDSATDPGAVDEGREYVLKVALDSEREARLGEEAAVLHKLRGAQWVVPIVRELTVGGRRAILLERAGSRTLADFLREEGRPNLEQLERFGEDLLAAVRELEELGIPHRDIKPDNIGIRDYGKSRARLVLFDFSLSRAPIEEIRLGTIRYLDPFLGQPGRPRWDAAAERWAAAVTLYEMAASDTPRWGKDGSSDPLTTDAPLHLDAERFDEPVREDLAEFFARAFDRDAANRFDNADDMLREWRRVFDVERARPRSRGQPVHQTELAWGAVTLDSPVSAIGLSTRAQNILDRLDVLRLRDLLGLPRNRWMFLRGVGTKTREEIRNARATLAAQFPDFRREVDAAAPAKRPRTTKDDAGGKTRERENATGEESAADPGPDPRTLAIEEIWRRLLGGDSGKKTGVVRRRVRRILLGADPDAALDPATFPGQRLVAELAECTPARVGQILGQERERWAREPALSALRDDIAGEVDKLGGVAATAELLDFIVASRPSAGDRGDKALERAAAGVARAAIEVEGAGASPRFRLVRYPDVLFIARSASHARLASQLGREADALAHEDPLLPAARSAQRLRSAIREAEIADAMSDDRLLRLAAAASESAELSAKGELYPRGMSAERALSLAAGAFQGLGLPARPGAEPVPITRRDLAARVKARYPHAGDLPDGGETARILEKLGLRVRYRPADDDFVREEIGGISLISSGSSVPTRLETREAPQARLPITPERAEAARFEEDLRHRQKHGAFLVLSVAPKGMKRCEEELVRRFSLDRQSLDRLLIDLLREKAAEDEVSWDTIREADRAPTGTEDARELRSLVREVLPRLAERLLASERDVLLVHPGLLVRYEAMSLIERLRDEVGRHGRTRALWLLVPDDEQSSRPRIDGREVPLISAGQHARVPKAWLRNEHRAGMGASG